MPAGDVSELCVLGLFSADETVSTVVWWYTLVAPGAQGKKQKRIAYARIGLLPSAFLLLSCAVALLRAMEKDTKSGCSSLRPSLAS